MWIEHRAQGVEISTAHRLREKCRLLMGVVGLLTAAALLVVQLGSRQRRGSEIRQRDADLNVDVAVTAPPA
jgi:hypothetical protein